MLLQKKMSDKQKAISRAPEFGFIVKLDHQYPEKPSGYFRPSLRIIWDLFPLFFRYVIYYIECKITGKSVIMDFIRLKTADQIYGVPLGGIGSGTIGRGFKGEFCRFQLRPGQCDYGTVDANQFIVTIKDENHTTIFQSLLSAFKRTNLHSWKNNLDPKKCTYTALYPRSWTEYDLTEYGVKLTCRQISPVIPHDYESSCLPCSVFVWSIENVSDVPRSVTVAFTFKNGVGVKKVDKQSTSSSKSFSYQNTEGVILYHTIDKVQGSYSLAVKSSDDVKISKCLHFNPNSSGADLWKQLEEAGQFEKIPEKSKLGHHFGEMGCGIAGKTTVDSCQSADIEMALVWDIPTVQYAATQRKFYKFYTEKFGKENAGLKIVDYALENYPQWEKKIFEWQEKVFEDKELPDWYKSALFNESYFVSEGASTWLSLKDQDITFSENDPRKKYGRFAYIEGLEYRMLNSYDVNFYGSAAYSHNWPELQKCLHYDLRDFVLMEIKEKRKMLYGGEMVQRKIKNGVPHDAGNPGEGPFDLVNAYNIHDVSDWKDLNSKFVLQTYRDAMSSSEVVDKNFVTDMYDTCEKVINTSMAYDTNNDGLIENGGFPDQTYDAWVMSGSSAYCGGLWLGALYVMSKMAETLGKTQDKERYEKMLEEGKNSLEKKLWNGKYYNFDCSHRKETIMADQLNAHWYLSCCGFGNNYPVFPKEKVRSALQVIYENNVKKFCNGTKGAVNGIINGGVDMSSLQSQEVWTGVTYALAATMIQEGMTEEAFHTAGNMFNTMTEKMGLIFDTPEALYEKDYFRSLAYMRPLSIWSMQKLWEARKSNKKD